MKKWLLPTWMAVFIFAGLPAFGTSVQIGINFTASTFGVDSAALPADANGVIGPAHYVELINGQFAVFDKSTGQRVLSLLDETFWVNAGISLGRTLSVTDPRVIYDGSSGRWFASMVDVNNRRQQANRFLLAVSNGSDPTQGWQAVAIPAANGQNYFADFPTLGIDANGVYLSGDLFDLQENPAGPIVVAIPKTSLLSNPPATSGMYSSGLQSYDTRGEILQPAVLTGSTSTPDVLLSVGDLGLDFAPHSTLILTPIKSDSGGFSLGPSVAINVPSYEIPINPVQPGGIDSLDNGDTRFSAQVRRVGDILYATHSIEIDDRAAVRWYRIDAAKQSLLESGTITNSELELFFPSIAADANGTVVIGCNGTSANQFISSYAYIGRPTNGVLSFEGPILLKAGLAAYDTHDSSGASRWGDYSATTADLDNPGRFWTIQCLPVDSTTWATQVTELIVDHPPLSSGPSLSITHAGTSAQISWAWDEGEKLQFSTSLSPPDWRDVPGVPTIANAIATQSVTLSGVREFYRVIQR